MQTLKGGKWPTYEVLELLEPRWVLSYLDLSLDVSSCLSRDGEVKVG